jgi:hypothetical protein
MKNQGSKWHVRISVQVGENNAMTATHNFRTKREALAFITNWRKTEDRADAGVELFRHHGGGLLSKAAL